MKYDYDIAVIGAGSGGLTVAFGLAAAGKSVALIERGQIGGDCTNFGCIPSKALIDIAKSGKYTSLKDALIEVRVRRQKIQDEETVEKIERKNLKVFQGFASFLDEHTLSISDTNNSQISAKNIVIATGSSAVKIDIPGVGDKDILTNHEIFEQRQDIKNLIVIGGGYIGCELAESISALGTKVHIIQRNERLIPNEEKESSDLLRYIFESKGIGVHTGKIASTAKNGALMMTDTQGNHPQSISYDTILIALGRKSNIVGLQLENAGVSYGEAGVSVNKYNQTNKKHIFAIGDCVENNPQFTHWANNEARGVIRNIILPFPKKSVRNMYLPAVLYTHCEIARVGKTTSELLKRYTQGDFVTKIMYFEKNDRSKVSEDTAGFVKINFSRLTGKILGATIFGSHAGEMLAMITTAMDNKISAYKLATTIQAYPTKSDLMKRVLDAYVIGTLGNIKNELQFFLKTNALQLITALIWISLIVTFFYYKNTNNLSFEALALGIYNFLGGNIWGPILYIIIYTIRPIVLFPGTFMTFMGGALFGPIYGVLYTVIAGTSSAIFAYYMGQVFGKKLLSEDGGGVIATLKKQVDSDPFMSVLMTRLLFFPYDITNYACGFLKVDKKSFILATCIGIIPGVSVFVLAGSAFYSSQITSFSDAIRNVDTSLLIAAAGLFVATTLFAKILRKIKK